MLNVHAYAPSFIRWSPVYFVFFVVCIHFPFLAFILLVYFFLIIARISMSLISLTHLSVKLSKGWLYGNSVISAHLTVLAEQALKHSRRACSARMG